MIRVAALLLLIALPLRAHTDPGAQVSFEPRIGALLPTQTQWRDHEDRLITLDHAFGGKPALLVLAYYRCPMLCPRVLQTLARSLRDSGLSLSVVVASIDPDETAADARTARHRFLALSGMPEGSVRFLAGPATASNSLAQAAGIRYVYDAEHDEYAHPALYLLIDGNGHVLRYLPVFTTTVGDLRLALTDTNISDQASVWDHALLLCYAYDPLTGRYTLAITVVLRVLGVATAAGLALLFWRLHRKGAR